jgi:phenylpropionate dioxygenase-like ring-hydroxylating dioxygenase large terminal subunit
MVSTGGTIAGEAEPGPADDVGSTITARQGDEPPAAAGVRVNQVLRDDAVAPEPVLLEQSPPSYGQGEVEVERYISQEWHDREMRNLWPRVWQVACREEELRRVGEHVLYEIGEHRLIVVRSEPGRIRAFRNACLHRGTELRDRPGCVNKFRCPFHGFTWKLDGTLAAVPSEWDFPRLNRTEMTLPEARVETFAGFVFINLDENAKPLSHYLSDAARHFEPFALEKRYKAVHVSQVVPCNWKVALEAFFEGFHVPYAHPQTVRYYDAAVQYDVWPDQDHFSRLIEIGAMASLHVRDKVTSQEILDAFQRYLPKEQQRTLAAGETARPYAAEILRAQLASEYRTDLSHTTDSDVLDQIQYFFFPNVIPWATVGAPLVYRFRPYDDSPHQSLMEVYYLHPAPDDDPTPEVPAEIRLEPGAQWGSVAELGAYGPVFDQDMPNLERVQRGLRTTTKKTLPLAGYQESRIIHFHKILERYVNTATD